MLLLDRYQKGYQEQDNAVSSIITKVKGTAATCTVNIPLVNCTDAEVRVWDTADYVIPAQETNAVFILTNSVETPQQTQREEGEADTDGFVDVLLCILLFVLCYLLCCGLCICCICCCCVCVVRLLCLLFGCCCLKFVAAAIVAIACCHRSRDHHLCQVVHYLRFPFKVLLWHLYAPILLASEGLLNQCQQRLIFLHLTTTSC